jgi:hypothetical protein
MYLIKPDLDVNQCFKSIKWLIFLIVFLPSCEKEYCWECEASSGYRSGPMFPWTITTSSIEYCNKTEKELNDLLNKGNYQGMNTFRTMTCTRR